MRIEPGSRSRCTERLNFRHPIRLNSFSSHYEPFRRAPLPLFTTANEDIISNRFSLSFSLLSSSHPLVSFLSFLLSSPRPLRGIKLMGRER